MNTIILRDEFYMKLALEMAAATQGQTGSNPVVGCVVVKEGRVVGLGAHFKQGSAHAEIHALRMAGKEAVGSTVYVTLEPCSHHGLTGPCSERLIVEQVSKVVVACEDPNPLVAGRGISRLREHGVEVVVGVLEHEAKALNEKFNKFIIDKLPFVTLKTASTLDGKIASSTGDSQWITNEHSREVVHQLRHQHEAIMVGVETVLQDDPSLTTRLTVPAIHPVRVVIDSRLRTPLEAKVIQDGIAPTLILTTDEAKEQAVQAFQTQGIQVIRCGTGPRVDLTLAMQELGKRRITSVLLEGGGTLNGAMLQARLINKMICFIAPKIIGGYDAPHNFRFSGFSMMKDAITLRQLRIETYADNVCISGYPVYEGGET